MVKRLEEQINKVLEEIINPEETAMEEKKILERMMGDGFQECGLYIVGGRPAIGKTTFALLALREMLENNTKIGILTSSEKKFIKILLCAVAAVEQCHLVNEEVIDKLKSSAEWLSNRNLMIESIGSTPMDKLSDLIKAENEIVLIDDFDSFARAFNDDMNSTMKKRRLACEEIKRVAMEEVVSIVALTNVNRKCDIRKDKHPRISDLGIEGIEQLADAILMLYRDSYYESDGGRGKGMEVTIAHNVRGPIGTVCI